MTQAMGQAKSGFTLSASQPSWAHACGSALQRTGESLTAPRRNGHRPKEWRVNAY
jgi:hypothetical protein